MEFGPGAKRIAREAQHIARRLGSPQVELEHLLLAFAYGPDGQGKWVLDRLGVASGRIAEEVGRRTAVSARDPGEDPGFSEASIKARDYATALAEDAKSSEITSAHLLAGISEYREGVTEEVLDVLELSRERLASTVKDALARFGAEGRSIWGTGKSLEHGPWHSSAKEAERMWQRFTERARRVVFFAQEEAARLGENSVGTEYLLLGLVRETDSVAARILDRLDVPLGRIRSDIERQVTRRHGNLSQNMELTPRGKRVIDLAYECARGLNNDYIGTEHLLLGLIREGDGLGARVLVNLGADYERTYQEVVKMQEGEAGSTGIYGPRMGIWERAIRFLTGTPAPQPLPAQDTDAETKPTYMDLLVRLVERVLSETPGAPRSNALLATDLAREVCTALPDLRAITDLSTEQARALLCLARVLKLAIAEDKSSNESLLRGKTLAMVFEKPSLRTRVSFEVGMFQLGGHALYLQPSDISMGKRESVADVARNLDRMVDGIMARVFAHSTILELAEHSRVPVINGLCDREHPCQALADLLTVWEKLGSIEGKKIAYIGDGNNVAHSLMLLGAKLGAHVVVACPEGYDPDPEIVAAAQAEGAGSASVTHDPVEACRDADVVYTDVWASMGQESEAAERAKIFAPFQVNEALVAHAKPEYLFMHCLPAHRGEEVSAGVMDGPNSAVFDQAENRLHAQKAVLAVLLR